MIAIVDYGMGNLRSVSKAFESLGHAVSVVSDPEAARKADRLVVPGVGAFPDAMDQLRQTGLESAILEFAKSGRPLLGVCLGLQLFFEASEEYGEHKGLGLFPGRVVMFPKMPDGQGGSLKVPHMGWNTLQVRAPELKAFEDAYVYFVHSYYVQPTSPGDIAATTGYGIDFCAMAARDNVWGAQFHPEKSGPIGLKLLDTWAKKQF